MRRRAWKEFTILSISLGLLLGLVLWPTGVINGVEPAAAMGERGPVAQTSPTATAEPTLVVTPTRQTTVTTPESSLTTTTGITQTAGATAVSANEPAARLTELLDYTVENSKGEPLAEIEDLLIGLESNTVTYAVLSFGGFLDIGDQLVTVPFDRFRPQPEDNLLILEATEADLANAPGFEPENWPNLIWAGWDVAEQGYWGDGEAEAGPPLGEPTARASELLGFDVVNADLQNLGEIEDGMVGLESGRVNYAVLSFGGFLDLGEKLFAIPIDALTFHPQRGAIIFGVREEALENAPGFDPANWPNTANPRWDVDSGDYWATPGRLPASPPPSTVAGAAPQPITAAAIRASQALDYEVTNRDGETIGQIEELLVGITTGQVNYAIISFGAAGDPDQLYPVPFPTLRLERDAKRAIFSFVDDELLTEAPSFARDDWPDFSDPLWAEPLLDYYWRPPVATGGPGVRVSELLTYDFQNLAGETLGQVEDITVSLTGRYVTYAVLSLDQENDQPGEALYPIPYTLVAVDLEQEALVTDLTQRLLDNAPSFPADRWPPLETPTWELFYRNYWITVGTTPTATATGELFVNESDLRLAELLDYPLQDVDFENLGEVEDVLIDLDANEANYVVVSFGGLLDLFGEELYIIPLDRFTVDSLQNTVRFEEDVEILEEAPSFTPGEWPDFADPDWDGAVRNFWAEGEIEETGETVTRDTPVNVTTMRATELLGYGVVNAQLEPLGGLEDLVVGLDSGRLKYAVLSFGGFLGIGDKLFAIPLNSLVVDPINNVIAFDVTQEALENAPGFDPDNWPDTANPRWDVDSSTYWQRQAMTGALLPAATTRLSAETANQAAARASDLLGNPIFNQEGEQIGAIEDMLVGAISGRVHFIVASFEGLDLAEQLYLVPATLIGFDPQEVGFILTVEDIATLSGSPGFSADEWPEVVNSGWAEPFWTYWAASPIAEEPAVRASDLLSYTLLERGGPEIGQVQGMFVGLINETVDFVVVSLTDAPAELYPVPFSLLVVEPAEESVVVNVGRGILEDAPTFNPDRWPDTANPRWSVIYRNYWASAIVPPPASLGVGPNLTGAGLKATELLEFEVETPQLDDEYQIEDLVVDLDNGQVKFAVIAPDIFAGLEESFLTVPLNALAVNLLEYRAVWNVSPAEVESVPRIEAGNWLGLDSPQWQESFNDYWGVQIDVPPPPDTTGDDGEQPVLTELTNIRATRLLDYEVENMAAEGLGEIEDLVIDLEQETVKYAVLAYDEGLFDLGGDLLPIPVTELTINRNSDAAIFDVDPDTLENAPALSSGAWPNPANPDWEEQFRSYWQNLKQQ